MQTAEAETRKYEEAQQSEQSAFQANIADLTQAVVSMQSYTDMSVATAVAEEVCFATSWRPILYACRNIVACCVCERNKK